MFSPRWRKMLRDVWLHKSRSLLVVLAVATGMIGSGALLDAWALVQRVTDETYRGSHPVSATLRVDAIDAALLTQIRALPTVAAARVRRALSATALVNGTELNVELFALQDFGARDIARLESERGVWPPRDGEISIEKSSLEFSGTRLGGSIDLHFDKQPPQTLPISGIAHDVSLPPGWMDHVVYGFVTPATLAMLGAPASLNEIQIVVRDTTADRDTVRQIAYAIKALIERGGKHVVNIDVPVPGQHAHAAQMNSLMLTQGAFGLLTLLVCSFLVVNLIAAMLAGQTREIGVMKSLGASAQQIATMYLGFALLLGLFASAIALPIALAIARPYAALKADMLNFSVAGFAVPWWAIALQLGVGCLLPVLAAAIPVMRACRLPVSAALRDAGICGDAGSAFVRRRISIPGISRPLLLSLGNAFRRRQRMLLTLLALAAGGAVFLGADDLRHSVREAVDELFSSERYDIVLRLRDAYPAARSEAAAAVVPGVQRVQAIASTKASIEHADGMLGNAFRLVALPPASPMFVDRVEQGRWLNAADRNALVVSRALLKDEPTLVPGAQVRLMIDGTATEWHIVGVQPDIQALAYVPLATFNDLHASAQGAALLVTTQERGSSAQLDVVARLRSELEHAGMPVANSWIMSESRRALEDHLLMVVQFLGVMGWVMIVIGGMGLASTMSLAVLERTREIGVLRAIGARHRAIMVMVLIEGLVIGVLGWAASIPLSMPMSALLADSFGRVMFSVPTHYLPSAAAASTWLLLVVAVALIACAWPALRATRVPAARALSYE